MIRRRDESMMPEKFLPRRAVSSTVLDNVAPSRHCLIARSPHRTLASPPHRPFPPSPFAVRKRHDRCAIAAGFGGRIPKLDNKPRPRKDRTNDLSLHPDAFTVNDPDKTHPSTPSLFKVVFN